MYKTQQWLSTLGFFWGEMYLFAYNWGNAIVVHHAVHQVLKFLVIWNFFQAAVEDASAAGGVLAFLHAHQYVIAFWNVVKPPRDKNDFLKTGIHILFACLVPSNNWKTGDHNGWLNTRSGWHRHLCSFQCWQLERNHKWLLGSQGASWCCSLVALKGHYFLMCLSQIVTQQQE